MAVAKIIETSAVCQSCESENKPYVFLLFVGPPAFADALCSDCFGAWMRLASAEAYRLENASKSR